MRGRASATDEASITSRVGGEESAHLVHHTAEVLGVDQGGQFGADQVLGGAAVHPGERVTASSSRA